MVPIDLDRPMTQISRPQCQCINSSVLTIKLCLTAAGPEHGSVYHRMIILYLDDVKLTIFFQVTSHRILGSLNPLTPSGAIWVQL